jgi:hypothetical protein
MVPMMMGGSKQLVALSDDATPLNFEFAGQFAEALLVEVEVAAAVVVTRYVPDVIKG